MRPKTFFGCLWQFLLLLCFVCSTPGLQAEPYTFENQDHSIRTHQYIDAQVLAQNEPFDSHGSRSKLKGTDVIREPGAEPVVDGRNLKEWLKMLESSNPDDRISACMALEKMGPAARPAIPALRRTLKDADVTVRILAASAIGAFGPDAGSAVPDLVIALQDENKNVRIFAINALGRIGSRAREGAGALENALKDPDALVRSQAKWALQQIKSRDRPVKAKIPEKTEPLPDKFNASVSPQEIPTRAFQSQAQPSFYEPVKIAPDNPNFDNASALMEAAQVGDLDKAQLLLTGGVNPDWIVDETQRTPLHEAAAFGRISIVRALIQTAIDRNRLNRVIGAIDKRHRTPLHDAAVGGDVNIAGILLDHGAMIDAADGEGLQPLHLAVINGNNQMVKFLIAKGAYVEAHDARGRTPRDYARAIHQDDLARYLEDTARQYWESPTVRKIQTAVKNYLAAIGSGDRQTAHKISTQGHKQELGDTISPVLFNYVIEEIRWHDGAAKTAVRIAVQHGEVPLLCVLDLKQEKTDWLVDHTSCGFSELWEAIK